MLVKLDENLPTDLVVALRALGHDVEDVYAEGLSGRPDNEIWTAAQTEARLLVTQDIRFGDARMFTPGAHAGFVLLRLKRADLPTILDRLSEVFANDDVETWAGCFIVVGESKVRVRRPQ
jgi:predicted nuclease of predicted toxin-antitoxin system